MAQAFGARIAERSLFDRAAAQLTRAGAHQRRGGAVMALMVSSSLVIEHALDLCPGFAGPRFMQAPVVVVTAFQWINGGQYAVAALVWFVLGWIDVADRQGGAAGKEVAEDRAPEVIDSTESTGGSASGGLLRLLRRSLGSWNKAVGLGRIKRV